MQQQHPIEHTLSPAFGRLHKENKTHLTVVVFHRIPHVKPVKPRRSGVQGRQRPVQSHVNRHRLHYGQKRREKMREIRRDVQHERYTEAE